MLGSLVVVVVACLVGSALAREFPPAIVMAERTALGLSGARSRKLDTVLSRIEAAADAGECAVYLDECFDDEPIYDIFLPRGYLVCGGHSCRGSQYCAMVAWCRHDVYRRQETHRLHTCPDDDDEDFFINWACFSQE